MDASGRPVTVRKLRYDGSVGWEIAGVLVQRSEPLLVVHHPVGTPVYVDGRAAWQVRNAPLVHYLWTDRWYSVYDSPQRDADPEYYGNVQTPARLDGDVITYTDLDLDVVKAAGRPPDLVDEDEFLENAAAMGYPPEVVEQAWSAAACLLRLLAAEAVSLS